MKRNWHWHKEQTNNDNNNNNSDSYKIDNSSSFSKSSYTEPEIIVPLHKRLGAELIGTFALVFTAVGSDMSDTLYGHALGKLAVAAAPGLVIMAMIYGLDRISGAYFNPAISIGFSISRHLKVKDLPLYILVQIIGSILASAVAIVAIGYSNTSAAAGHAGLTIPLGKGGWIQSFVLEMVLTFFLMFVSISMKEDKDILGYKKFGGIAIGATIILAGIIGIQVSGASMNPARSFGPALVIADDDGSSGLLYNWIYWVAPIIGSILAVYSFKMVKTSEFFTSISNSNNKK
jgi:MIP family channel proteins